LPFSIITKKEIDIEMDFDDGVAIAKIVKRLAPQLFVGEDPSETLWQSPYRDRKRENWEILNCTVLKYLSIQLSEEFVSAILNHQVFEPAHTISLFEASQELDFALLDKATPMRAITKQSAIQRLLHLIKNQLSKHACQFSQLQELPTVAPGKDTSHMVLHVFKGRRIVNRRRYHKRRLVRLTNVDYITKKPDVVTFLYPLIVFPEDIHIPIHLSTGKMTYEIYLEFSNAAVFQKALEVASGSNLLSRRVEAHASPVEDLLVVLFGRTHKQIDETTVFLSDDQKERMWKLCWNAKNTFNGKTPSRPFEQILSCVKLLPWNDPLLSQCQKDRACSMLKVAIKTLKQYDDQKHAFAPSLISEMIQVVENLTDFSPEQKIVLSESREARSQSGPSPRSTRGGRRHSHDGVVRRLEQLAQEEESQHELYADALGPSLWSALLETSRSRKSADIQLPGTNATKELTAVQAQSCNKKAGMSTSVNSQEVGGTCQATM